MPRGLDTLLVPQPTILLPLQEGGGHRRCIFGRMTVQTPQEVQFARQVPSRAGPSTNIPYAADLGNTVDLRLKGLRHISLVGGDIDLTISAWLRQDSTSMTGRAVGMWAGSNEQYGFYHSGTSWGFSVYDTVPTAINVTYATANDTNWHHIVGVRNATAGNIEIYVDGVASGSPTTMSNDVEDPGLGVDFSIGGDSAVYWDGGVAQVAIWPTTLLTAAQISALYNGGNGVRVIY